ncbi:hypothetical protein GEV33_004534 [Tenebrio molitor]|uniref:Uncharacterized protein n=1 Tax=Tenebrio molitor TaxID=7067 RepID=A0A8J6LFK8_TENMO|nr:hypothetical protein GEV33_004534 [Tenebrio molitor]
MLSEMRMAVIDGVCDDVVGRCGQFYCWCFGINLSIESVNSFLGALAVGDAPSVSIALKIRSGLERCGGSAPAELGPCQQRKTSSGELVNQQDGLTGEKRVMQRRGLQEYSCRCQLTLIAPMRPPHRY